MFLDVLVCKFFYLLSIIYFLYYEELFIFFGKFEVVLEKEYFFIIIQCKFSGYLLYENKLLQ